MCHRQQSRGRSRQGVVRTWGSLSRRCGLASAAMKELVYHRHLLPAVVRYADKVGFIDGSYSATYAQHLDRVGRVSGALKELGVGRGDRFAVMALNSHQFLE